MKEPKSQRIKCAHKVDCLVKNGILDHASLLKSGLTKVRPAFGNWMKLAKDCKE